MAEAENQPEPQSAPAAETTELDSLLEKAISATKQTERSRAEELLQTLKQEVLSGTVTWSKNLNVTFEQAIRGIDQMLSAQLAEIMHSEAFQKLEGSWRGLHHLVSKSETGAGLKLRVLNVSKKDLHKDVSKAVEFDQSTIFKKLYENEFGTPGGEPYGALIGDYEFSTHPDDMDLLTKMSEVSAAAFCPFITAPAPGLFGFESWTELSKPRDLEKIFSSAEHTQWRSFRDSDDSRFVSMVMPRVLARLPYGKSTKPVDAFDFEEVTVDKKGMARPVDHGKYCWMNAAYVMGTTLTSAFAQHGWCTAIRGAEGGGKVEGLPVHVFRSDDGDVDTKCPTEIGITDRREAELSKLGFLSLGHYKNTDYAVFFGAQTAQKPRKYDDPDATDNAAISARLPYIMACSRFAHYLKVMARDKIGSFMEASDCENWLNNWIMNYVNANKDAGQEMKAKFPLADASIKVMEIPGQPGAYNAVAFLRPWLQMEELTTSMRLVARIPKAGG